MRHIHKALRVWCVLRGHKRKFSTYPVRGICIRCGSLPPQYLGFPR